MQNANKIAILLCTYRSAEYLAELLGSLRAQTFSDFRVFVHDDGSDDGTLDILRAWAAEWDRLELLDDPCPGRRAKGSFVWLMEQVESDYYMFCDHDDVWLPFKIEKSYAEMLACEQRHPGMPVAVNTDLRVVDQDLNVVHPSFWQYNGICRPLLSDFGHLAVYNAFTGCAMIFNRAARDLSLPVHPKATMHDKWVALKVADAGGCLGYVDEATILYRQHADNQVGANQVDGKYYFQRILHLRETLRKMRDSRAMGNAIRPFPWHRFFRYKLSYLIGRCRYKRADSKTARH